MSEWMRIYGVLGFCENATEVLQDLEKEVETLRNGPSTLPNEAWLSGAEAF